MVERPSHTLLGHVGHLRVFLVKLLDQLRELGPPDLLVLLVLGVQGIPIDGSVAPGKDDITQLINAST